MSKILGLVTARGGSKSIPRKNVLPLAGKPLIGWTIETALQVKNLDRLVLSTDDDEIAQVGRQWGAEVPFVRPATFSQDTSSHISVVTHALGWLRENDDYWPDYVLLMQPTSPLRTKEDIDGIIQTGLGRQARAVVSVCRTDHHPYLVKCIQEDGSLVDFISGDLAYLRRQDLPPAYALNGAMYFNSAESLLQDQTFLPPGTLAYIMPPERSLDINTAFDFHLVELVLQDRMKHAND